MTTTLRPTEPLQRAADGTRSRHYQVCVNSRPVGTLHLGTSSSLGESVAAVLDLTVQEQDRRRGRGTVAALAAEEVARGWGCRVIEANIPASAVSALRLADALAYRPRNRGMRKRLADTPPALPAGSLARPMTPAEYTRWRTGREESYAREWMARGVPEEAARAKSRHDHETLLPQGLATQDMEFSVVEHEGAAVGALWLCLARPGEGGGKEAFVYYVESDPAHRGRGHGRTLMLVAERQAAAAGRDTLGLNVFAGNGPAEGLYTSLGYGTTLHGLQKPLL